MTVPTRLTLTTVNLDTPDPAALARFYARLLGWDIAVEEADDVILRAPTAGSGCPFSGNARTCAELAGAAGRQQMMMHLEIGVRDLPAALEHALACGATLAAFQPQEDVRVCLDPDGHPFCLWLVE